MSDSPSRKSIVRHLNAGTQSAANILDEQYRSKLCRLVEREMNRRFRSKEDPEDVVQSVFRSFYTRNAKGEFHIDSSADLWRLLVTITRHKILKHVEKLSAKKRTPQSEEYTEGNDLRGQEPTPDEVIIAADLMEKVLTGLDDTYVKVFHWRLQKYTEEEIAAKLNRPRSVVQTKLKRIRGQLQLLLDGDSDDDKTDGK